MRAEGKKEKIPLEILADQVNTICVIDKTHITDEQKLEHKRAGDRIRRARYYAKHKERCRESHNKWIEKKFGSKQAYRKFLYERNPELYKAFAQKSRKKNPHIAKAGSKLEWAIRKGDIIRQPCIKCGNPKSQGHHEDYSKPLDVIWLCVLCHKRLHLNKTKELNNARR